MSHRSRQFSEIVDRAYGITESDDRIRAARHQAGEARLDAFLAAHGEQRAAIWRLADEEERRELVTRQLIRTRGTWSELWIAAALDFYTEKYGAAPTATESAAVGALDAAIERSEMAQRQGGDVVEREFFAAEWRAYTKARDHYVQDGIRPQADGDGWRVASATQAGVVYTVTRSGRCSCPAGQHDKHCWHAAMVVGVDLGYDDMNIFDDPVEPEYAEAARLIGQRLAAVRAKYAEVA